MATKSQKRVIMSLAAKRMNIKPANTGINVSKKPKDLMKQTEIAKWNKVNRDDSSKIAKVIIRLWDFNEGGVTPTLAKLNAVLKLWQSASKDKLLPRHPKFLREWNALGSVIRKALELANPEMISETHMPLVIIGDGPSETTHYF